MNRSGKNPPQPTWPTGMLSGRGSEIRPAGFPASVELFRQVGGELPDLIAAALPAHTQVLTWLGSLPATDARWFYITCPDNVIDVLEWVRPCRQGTTDPDRLGVFRTQPAAEGGVSFLGHSSSATRRACEPGTWFRTFYAWLGCRL